jgi:hypothetical protein
MPKPTIGDLPTDEEILAEAWKAIEFLREACPLPYRVRNIFVKPKMKKAVANVDPDPAADGGPITDMTLSRAGLIGEWRIKIWTRIFHEWMELALTAQRLGIEQNACIGVTKAVEDLCETASVLTESMARKIFSLLHNGIKLD